MVFNIAYDTSVIYKGSLLFLKAGEFETDDEALIAQLQNTGGVEADSNSKQKPKKPSE